MASFNTDEDVREQIPNNPESFVSFALAAYMYANPPETPDGSTEKPAVLFARDGFPHTASTFMAGHT